MNKPLKVIHFNLMLGVGLASQLNQVAYGFVESNSELLQGQRFCCLYEQSVLVLGYSNSKKFSCMSVWNLSCCNLCPLLLVFSPCSSEKSLSSSYVCLMLCILGVSVSFLWTPFHLSRSLVFGYSKLVIMFQVHPHKCWGNNHLPRRAGTLLLMRPRRWLAHCQLCKANC